MSKAVKTHFVVALFVSCLAISLSSGCRSVKSNEVDLCKTFFRWLRGDEVNVTVDVDSFGLDKSFKSDREMTKWLFQEAKIDKVTFIHPRGLTQECRRFVEELGYRVTVRPKENEMGDEAYEIFIACYCWDIGPDTAWVMLDIRRFAKVDDKVVSARNESAITWLSLTLSRKGDRYYIKYEPPQCGTHD